MKRFLAFALGLVPAVALAIGTWTYTNPVTVPDADNAVIMRFGMVVMLNEAGNPSADSYYRAVINVRNEDNEVINSVTVIIPWASIPDARQSELRNLYDLTLQYAVNQGIIPAGTAGDDL